MVFLVVAGDSKRFDRLCITVNSEELRSIGEWKYARVDESEDERNMMTMLVVMR